MTESRSERPAELSTACCMQLTLFGAEGHGNHLLSARNLDGQPVCREGPFALFQGVGGHAVPRFFESGEHGIANRLKIGRLASSCEASAALPARRRHRPPHAARRRREPIELARSSPACRRFGVRGRARTETDAGPVIGSSAGSSAGDAVPGSPLSTEPRAPRRRDAAVPVLPPAGRFDSLSNCSSGSRRWACTSLSNPSSRWKRCSCL